VNPTCQFADLTPSRGIADLFAANEPPYDEVSMQQRFDAWLAANTDAPQLITTELGRFHPETPVDHPPNLLRPVTAGPMMKRLVLGRHMRRLRESAYLTTEQAAAAIRGSSSKVSRLEHGRVNFKQRDIADLLTLYGITSNDEYESLMRLAWEANERSWWQDYSDVLPAWIEPYLDLEATAADIRSYETQLVHGLLQTEDYARAVIKLGNTASEAELNRRVEARLSRKDILSRAASPRLWAVIDEGALRRPIGGEAVMRDQLQHLLDMTEHPAIMLQVLPFQSGGHPALGGSFTILQFKEIELPGVVYIEQLTSALYLDRPAETDVYLTMFQQGASQAETVEDTPQVLKEILTDT
jgi:transcriptional regulator with XRE-family HTH domain